MASKRIRLEPNVPLTIALLDPFADSSERFDSELGQCEYRTVDGRILALPKSVAIELNNLDPQPGEEIGVCRYTGKQGRIAVWLASSSEKARAEAEMAQDQPEPPAPAVTPIRKPATRQDDQPRLFDRGTGTHGPAPQIQPAKQPRPAIAARTPYGDMLRHIIHTVESVLKAEGVQLGDAPKQDLYTTVYIDAAKRCGVVYDFTRGTE